MWVPGIVLHTSHSSGIILRSGTRSSVLRHVNGVGEAVHLRVPAGGGEAVQAHDDRPDQSAGQPILSDRSPDAQGQGARPVPGSPGDSVCVCSLRHPLKKWSLRKIRGGSPPDLPGF